MNYPPVARVILYVKDIPKVAAFYECFFGMQRLAGSTAGWQEMASPSGGCTIALHQAAKSQKSGAAVKIVFAVKDVEAFVQRCAREGLRFGSSTAQKDLSLQTPKIRQEIPLVFPAEVCNSTIQVSLSVMVGAQSGRIVSDATYDNAT